ncbi:pyridoxal phosphate-dependent aminotransferase [Hyalangium gracile]|uniref:pyridoxal phosphate-dependent aminotransferase n=1 Tax=Hyalangium gracile TaxID=394092 RepID=UPI001CCF6877|nr:pyridoxal phosphate-dependent aminotransferase [Hyalangium gracile]
MAVHASQPRERTPPPTAPMPRHPTYAPSVASMSGSVYSTLASKLARLEGEVYPLHVGDTWMEPPEGCRMEELRTAQYPGMHRYSPVEGHPALLDRIVEHVRARMAVPTERAHVLVTTGATGALGAMLGALLTPGEEVLLLAPYWPLISGIVRSFHGVPVPVPFLGLDSAEELVEAVRARLTERTVALYLNTPNNPTGRVLPREWMEALAALARREGLWLLSDEVYEHYVYTGEHVYARTLAPERTLSAWSFSKAYGMAGNRCGWVVGPAEAVEQLRKVSTHAFYSAPTASQLAGVRALQGPGLEWAAAAAAQYADTGRKVAALLGVPPPQGSTFLFVDVARHLDERGLSGFLERCVENHLLVAPGPSFGPFPHHVRLCFTCSPPDVVLRGAQVLARLMGR